MTATVAARPIRRVRVWLCGQPFIDHLEINGAEAERFADAMKLRFRCCRVTNDPYDMAQPAAPPGR